MINPSGKQAAASRLLYELALKMEEYSECMKRDEPLEVKKKIRLRLKEIEKQLEMLNEESSSYFIPNISSNRNAV